MSKRIKPQTAYEIAVNALAHKEPEEVIRLATFTLVEWNEFHAKRCEELERRIGALESRVNMLETQLRNAKGWGFVYLLEAAGYYKIGVSKDITRRKRQLAPLTPFEIDLICAVESDNAFSVEKNLHIRFADKRVRGEWFRLDSVDVEYIKGLGAESE